MEMQKPYALASRVMAVVSVVGGIAFAQTSASAGNLIGGYYEECNVDFHNSPKVTDWDVACSPEEVKELYHPGSYKEECWGEGCNTEERYELSEGRGADGKTDRVHDMMLNHFCTVRSSPTGSAHGWTFVKGVAQQHFRGQMGNYLCQDVGMDACTFWNQTFGMLLPMC